jgi:S-adenosylmethionine hydrolase
MLVLFTDFSLRDPYVGQMKAVLHRQVPGVPVVDLLHEVPAFDAVSGAHLLAALDDTFPPVSVFLAVVDPGVGSDRPAVVLEADGSWYVGPDNGLLSIVASRAQKVRCWEIVWRPERLSCTFHGRDLFAPVAARIAGGSFPNEWLRPVDGLQVRLDAGDLGRILYIDHYGNAITGLRAGNVPPFARLEAKGRLLDYVRVYAEAPPGAAFWCGNSAGLVEIAVSGGSAAERVGLKLGDAVGVIG